MLEYNYSLNFTAQYSGFGRKYSRRVDAANGVPFFHPYSFNPCHLTPIYSPPYHLTPLSFNPLSFHPDFNLSIK